METNKKNADELQKLLYNFYAPKHSVLDETNFVGFLYRQFELRDIEIVALTKENIDLKEKNTLLKKEYNELLNKCQFNDKLEEILNYIR